MTPSASRDNLGQAFEAALYWTQRMRPSDATGDAEWSKTKTEFASSNHDVAATFDYNADPSTVNAADEVKLRFVLQLVQSQGTNMLQAGGIDFTTNSEAWIQFYAQYPLLFNFSSRENKTFVQDDFALEANEKLVEALLGPGAPVQVRSALIATLQKASGNVLATTKKTEKLEYFTIMRNYGKASKMVIYRANILNSVTTVKTLCMGGSKQKLEANYDRVEFELNDALALAIYPKLFETAVDLQIQHMTGFFRQFAQDSWRRFEQAMQELVSKQKPA